MVVIVISGDVGAGSTTVARALAKRLGLDHFSPGAYVKSQSNAKTETDKALDVLKSEQGMRKSFHARVDELQIQKAKRGNIVIDGKLSFYFLHGLADYRIWLACSKQTRVLRTIQRDGLTPDEAERKLALRERIDAFNFEKMYGIKLSKLKEEADTSIDVSALETDMIVDKIMAFIRSRDSKNT
ncbi:hypothetical protein COT72_04710 [archaeon CG10_big_fil_rev_8_21_14_0_10_43_11]|nr:MAG: hypothetical protein COT72_04710 [archaeon CG10_big_fil_rev_8_21_14_0_10_43_11]